MAFLLQARAFFLAILPFLVGLGQENDIAERLLRSGERAYAAKSYSEALGTWAQLLEQAPKSPQAAQALLNMAKHQIEVDKKADVGLGLLDRIKLDYMQSAVAPQAMLLRGQILAARARKAADLSEAVAEFNRVSDLFAGSREALTARFHLGLAAMRQEQMPRALHYFIDVLRLDPRSKEAPSVMLHAAEVMDFQGDLSGCLRMLQELRTVFPGTPEADRAALRITLLTRQRILKAPLQSEGPWPEGRKKWLKTPTLLAIGEGGELYLYQDDLDRAFHLKDKELHPVGAIARNAKGMVVGASGLPWLLSAKQGLFHEENQPPLALPGSLSASAFCMDRWNNFWVADGKNGGITILGLDGGIRQIPSPAASAIATLPDGGVVLASDANRSLLFLDGSGSPRLTVPYGREMNESYKSVLSLSVDLVGNVAALVDGDFEGVILLSPDGSLLRQATLKSLDLRGRFRAIAQDHQGGILLADRSNDLIIRLY